MQEMGKAWIKEVPRGMVLAAVGWLTSLQEDCAVLLPCNH